MNESQIRRRLQLGVPQVAVSAALAGDDSASVPPVPGRCMGCYEQGFRGGQQQLVGRCDRDDQNLCGKCSRVSFTSNSGRSEEVEAADLAGSTSSNSHRSRSVSSYTCFRQARAGCTVHECF